MSGSSEDETRHDKYEEEDLDMMVEQAVEAATKGVNIEQLLEVMLASLPSSPLKEKLRKKFAVALRKRGLREPRPDTDIQAKSALARLQNVLAVSAKQAFDRVAALASSHPELAERIRQVGERLAQYGVSVERIQINESEMENFTPTPVAQTQKRDDTGRGF